MIAAVILAAGASTRFGSPKQLATWEGESLLQRAIRTAQCAGCSPVVVVLGAKASQIQETFDLIGAEVVVNDLWSEGMASSLRRGIAAVGEVEGAVVMTCDMPGVTESHIRALIRSGGLTASRYAGRNGVPAFFPAAFLRELLIVQGEAGARGLLRSAPSLDLCGGEADIDTPEDLERLVQSQKTRR